MLPISLFLAAMLLGYVCGSIPTGYWAGRILKGIDIREHGSGSMGATNVLRILGKGPALLVLAVDVGKGILALWLAQRLLMTLGPDWQTQLLSWIKVASGLAAIVGHSRPVWLGFKGGKSVATSLGILFALSWPLALTILGVWGLGMGGSRIVSLSSIVAAIAAPILAVLFGQPLAYCLFTLLGGAYVVLTHRRNIERLLAGTEPAIGRKLVDGQSPVGDHQS